MATQRRRWTVYGLSYAVAAVAYIALGSWSVVGSSWFLDYVVLSVTGVASTAVARHILDGPQALRGMALPVIGTLPTGASIVLTGAGERSLRVVMVLRDHGVPSASSFDAIRSENPVVLAEALSPDDADRWSTELAAAGALFDVNGGVHVS